jgi:hypothetical protein
MRIRSPQSKQKVARRLLRRQVAENQPASCPTRRGSASPGGTGYSRGQGGSLSKNTFPWHNSNNNHIAQRAAAARQPGSLRTGHLHGSITENRSGSLRPNSCWIAVKVATRSRANWGDEKFTEKMILGCPS